MASPSPQQPNPQLSHRFRVAQKSFSRNYEIRPEGQDNLSPSFVVEISNFSKNKPNLTLHAGPDDDNSNSPCVACVFLPGLSRHYKIGLGDPVGASEEIQWEDMRLDSPWSTTISWSMNLEDGKQHKFFWKRTFHVAADGFRPKRRLGRNWKLVQDDETNTLLAVYTSQTGLLPNGTLQFNVNWSAQFEWMVMVTLVALHIKEG